MVRVGEVGPISITLDYGTVLVQVQTAKEASEGDDRGRKGRGRKEVRSYGGSAGLTRHSISYRISYFVHLAIHPGIHIRVADVTADSRCGE